jgi:hypothetical protein
MRVARREMILELSEVRRQKRAPDEDLREVALRNAFERESRWAKTSRGSGRNTKERVC